MVDSIRKLMRPFITVALVGTTVYLAVVGKLEAKEILTATSIIIAFHFGERAALKKPNNDQTS
jgi:hypothetical protein